MKKQKTTAKTGNAEKAEKKAQIKRLAVLGLMLISIICVLQLHWDESLDFKMVNTDSLSYVRAEVISVDQENLAYDDLEPDRLVGTQEMTVQLKNGAQKGQTVTLTNYMTRYVNVYCKAGMTLVVCADCPEDAEPYYTVYSYNRIPSVIVIILIFCVIVLLVGRKKGAWSLLGLMYTMFMIFLFLVRAIFYGWSISLCTFATVAVTAAGALYLLGGPSRKTIAAFCATLFGVACSGVMYLICSALLHITGYQLESAESLLLINEGTGMSLKGLVFAAVLIAAYGAVMDVAVSISSSLDEIHTLNPEMTAHQLFRSGIHIGQDMTGTMTNTLILAYAGSALVTMLLLKGYGYGLRQLMNSDYLALELSQGLSATVGVVLTVPGASAVAARLLAPRGKTGMRKVYRKEEHVNQKCHKM